jgi:DNA anti-recombination protein RmuC
MNTSTQTILLITWAGSVLAILLAFIWVAVRLGPKGRSQFGGHKNKDGELFDDDFRAKLRQRGIARFEHTLDQHAVFLQQDLRRISDEVGEHIKDQATAILKEEFSDQKQSVAAASQHMSQAFAKMDQAISDYQKTMTEQLHKELLAEKQRRLERFSDNMADVITQHVQQTLSSHMEVGEQVQFIIKNMEDNKTAILEDIKREF